MKESKEMQEDKEQENKKEDKEESELEEKIENVKEEPQIIREIPLPKVTPPILEQIQAPEETARFDLEKDNFAPILGNKKQDELKYNAKVENLAQDYEDVRKRQEQQSTEALFVPTSTPNLEMLGRQRETREFHMQQPAELMQAQKSFHEDYSAMGNITRNQKDNFKGEKTAFQMQMEKRYEVKG